MGSHFWPTGSVITMVHKYSCGYFKMPPYYNITDLFKDKGHVITTKSAMLNFYVSNHVYVLL